MKKVKMGDVGAVVWLIRRNAGGKKQRELLVSGQWISSCWGTGGGGR